MPDREIICGGNPESQFARLEIGPECTFDGRWFGERWTVWRVDDAAWNRLIAEEGSPVDHWTAGETWWRFAPGSNLGGPDGTATFNGREFTVWDMREDPDDYGPDSYGDLPTYLCEHVGASTERNVTACLMDLARVNGMGLGEFLAAAMGETPHA